MFKKIIAVSVLAISTSVVPASYANTHAKSLQNLGANEIMFAQGMIPHHQQAIDMSKLALKNASSVKVKSLAKSIISAQSAEIKQMQYWLKATSSSEMMDHSMHMEGMLSQSQMSNLAKLKGSKFDAAFIAAMIEHHQGALEMVYLLKGSKNKEALKLLKDVQTQQSKEISEMKSHKVK